MKQRIRNENSGTNSKKVLDFFIQQAKVERQKKEGRQRVMEDQLDKATGGKKIILSNYNPM